MTKSTTARVGLPGGGRPSAASAALLRALHSELLHASRALLREASKSGRDAAKPPRRTSGVPKDLSQLRARHFELLDDSRALLNRLTPCSGVGGGVGIRPPHRNACTSRSLPLVDADGSAYAERGSTAPCRPTHQATPSNARNWLSLVGATSGANAQRVRTAPCRPTQAASSSDARCRRVSTAPCRPPQAASSNARNSLAALRALRFELLSESRAAEKLAAMAAPHPRIDGVSRFSPRSPAVGQSALGSRPQPRVSPSPRPQASGRERATSADGRMREQPRQPAHGQAGEAFRNGAEELWSHQREASPSPQSQAPGNFSTLAGSECATSSNRTKQQQQQQQAAHGKAGEASQIGAEEAWHRQLEAGELLLRDFRQRRSAAEDEFRAEMRAFDGHWSGTERPPDGASASLLAAGAQNAPGSTPTKGLPSSSDRGPCGRQAERRKKAVDMVLHGLPPSLIPERFESAIRQRRESAAQFTVGRMSSNPILAEDQFEIKRVDHEAHFDRVSRMEAVSRTLGLKAIIDINTDIYPVEVSDQLTIALAKTLELDGTLSSDSYDATVLTRPTLAERYDYVCHGTVYKVQASDKGDSVSYYISFGGLLMKLIGQIQKVGGIELNQKVYLLIRRL
ncbi:DNA-directed RNA polymerases II and V subunit 8A [Diplonema papillatum]|nr:DNA-directed RNA polymerases II and V subunit 8A [Diplonema papillatum]